MLTLVERKRFGILDKFSDSRNVDTLLVQFGQTRKNTADPSREASDGGKVKQKFGCAQLAGNGKPDKISISKSVSQKRKHKVCNASPKVYSVFLFPESGI